MILVTGAAGKTGLATLRRLLTLDTVPSVRALVRRDEQASMLNKLGVNDVVVGDLRNEADLSSALSRVDTVYHICPNMQPDEVEIGARLIDIAISSNVQRLVYHSVLHPQTQEMPHHWNKLLVEELLLKSNISFTILQPAAYMQNVLASWGQIVEEGLYQVPYDTEAKLAMVDLADVATVAARVLSESGHEGAIYELATSEWLTQHECAQIMSEVLEREVRATAIDRAAWQSTASQAGLPPYAIETLMKMFIYYEQFGFGGNGTVLAALLGGEPNSFRRFLLRHLQSTRNSSP